MADFTTRLIVVPIIKDPSGRVLICKMASDRGVFPGQWGLPGGGVEVGERIEEALHREVSEELGVSIQKFKPLFFKDGLHEKVFVNGDKRLIYMVFLLYECQLALNQKLHLNAEFSEYQWVEPSSLSGYDLNTQTQDTFAKLGLM